MLRDGNPFLITIICLATFFSPTASIISIKLLEGLVILLLSLFLYKSFQQKKIVFKRSNFDITIFLLFIFSTLNYFLHFNSFYAREAWLKLIFAILFYYLLVNSIQDEIHVQNFIDLFLFLAFVEAVFALSKRFYLGEARLTGTLASPNFLVGFLLPLFLLAGERFLNLKLEDKKYLKTVFLITFFILTFLCLIFSQSRSGMILFVVILFIWIYKKKGTVLKKKGTVLFCNILKGKERLSGNDKIEPSPFFSSPFFYRLQFVAFVLGILILFIFLTPNIKRFLVKEGGDTLSYYRLSVWKSTMLMIKENFWTGVGLDNFKNAYLHFKFPTTGHISRYGRFAQFAHNEFLELWVELGFAGLIIGILFLLKYIWVFLKKRNNNLGLALYKASALIILQSFFDYNLHHPAILVLFIFLLASSESLASERDKIFILNSPQPQYLSLIPVMAIFIFYLLRPIFSYYETRVGINEMKNKNQKLAIEHFQKAIKSTPDISSIHSYLAEAYIVDFKKERKLPALKNAEKHFRQAIYFEPENPVFYVKLGFFYFNYYSKNINLKLASQALEKSFIYDPYNAFFYYYLGKFYLSDLKFKEAEKWFLKSVEVEPNFLGARIYLAFIHEKENRKAELEQQMQEILRIEKLKNRALTNFERDLVTCSQGDDVFLNTLHGKTGTKGRAE